MDFFKNKTILILSPQPWNNLFLSKHNYARAFAASNKVIFVAAPDHKVKRYSLTNAENEQNLALLEYNIPLPPKIKFHWSWLYQACIKRTLRKILASEFDTIDVCIDFGCYQQYRSIDWVPAKYRIFFPVDDHDFLSADTRGADLILSVSENICKKFATKGKKCFFINHGLNKEFEEYAVKILKESKFWRRSEKIKVGYSGNLFISFLDTTVLKRILQKYPQVEFHFFGNAHFDKANDDYNVWNRFLRSASNVIIHGFLYPEELVHSLNEMDAFILCYKPDYKNYHGENSHKVFEYLSTGKVLITTYLSIHWGSPLMEMSAKDKNEDLIALFDKTITSLETCNSSELQKMRVCFALDNTYSRQINRIADLIDETCI